MARTLGLSRLPTTSSTGPFRLVKVTSLDDVDAWQSAWDRLGMAVPSPLAQFSWNRSALATFTEGSTPRVVAVWRGDEILALAPLAKRRLHGVRRLFIAGGSDLLEPADLVWIEKPALQRLLTGLARGGTPLVLERVPADSPSLAALRRAYRARAIVITRPQTSVPYIPLDESWLEPEQHLTAVGRDDLRRARHKAEQLGPVTTEIHAPGLDQLVPLVDTALAVGARCLAGEAGAAPALDAHRAVFDRQYFEAACTEGALRICFLRIGDRVAAMQLAVEQSGGLWVLKVGCDDRFAACSPAMLLIRDTIRYAVEAGLNTYEFLGRSGAWSRAWTETVRPCVSVRVYPLGARGLAALLVDGAAALAARWRDS